MRSERARRAPAAPFGLEALEPRLLLSADPVGTAVQALLPPDPHDAALAFAYAGAAAAAGGAAPFSDPATVLDADVTETSVNFVNSVRIIGSVTITASAGNAAIGNDSTDYVGGNSAATTDRLTVLAPAGDVRFRGAIGDGSAGTDPLASLTVIALDDVTFDREITLDGPLVIQAGGVVSFNGGVTLRDGGSLSITGATQVFFGTGSRLTLATGGAGTAGDILIAADEIDLRMGEELIVGSGTVTLRPASAAQAVALLNPAGVSDTTATLSLDRTEMAAFADGFAAFVVGRADGSGVVSVGASPNVDGVALPGPLTVLGGGRIDVTDYSSRDAILRLGPGDTLRLQAGGDIRIANEIEADRIELASTGGRVLSLDVATDGRTSEALRALVLDVDAAAGIGLARVEVRELDLVNGGAGDIAVTVGAARTTTRFDAATLDGSVTLQGLDQAGGGAATLATTAGGLTVAGRGVVLLGNGALTLDAAGSGSDLRLQAAVAVAGGPVLLKAADALSSTAAGSITASGAAAVTLQAGAGGLVLGAPVSTVGGSLSLVSGGALDLSGVALDAGGGGRIVLSAVGDLTVGVVAASVAIDLTSSGGAVRDGWAGDDANLRGEAAAVTLTAASGLGAAGAPLRSAVGSLVADAGSGPLFVAEASALAVGAAGLRAGGDLVVTTAAGALDVQGPVRAGQDVLLRAGGSGGSLTLAADVQASAGALSLVAAQALWVPALAPTALRSAGSGAGIDIRAGGDAAFGAGTQVLSGNGPLRIDAGGVLTLGRVDAGSGTASLRGGGGIATAAGTPAEPDVRAAALRLDAGSGALGSAADALQVATSRLALAAGGAAFVQVADAGTSGLVIGRLDGLAVPRVADDGSATTTGGDAALAGLRSGAAAVLSLAGGPLRIDEAVAATGALRVQAPGALTLAAPVSALGAATLLVGGALTATAAGDIDAATLDLEAAGDVAAADGTRWATTGALRVATTGALTLGQADAGSGSLSLQSAGALTSVFSGTAAELRGGPVRLDAAQIGRADDPVRLAADALAARSRSGDLHATEADGVLLAAFDALALPPRVGADGLAVARSDAEPALAGLSSAAALSLRSAGTLQGAAAATVASAGALLLAADGALADLLLAGELTATGGALQLAAGRDLQLSAAARADGGAQLLAGRDLALNAALATGAVDSRLQAGRDLAPGAVDTRGATLRLQAGGALLDGDAALDLQAAVLHLTAGAAVGGAADALEFDAATLTVAAGAGAWLAAAGPLTLASASAGGALELAAQGDLAVAGTVSGAALGLQSGGRLDLAAAAQLASGGGAARLQAASALTMADGSALATGGGDADLRAGGTVTVSHVDAGAGTLRLVAAALRDIAGDADTRPDLAAARLDATLAAASAGGFGTATDAIDTAVGALTLDVSGSGGVFIAQRGALQLDGLASPGALVLLASGAIEGSGAVRSAGALLIDATGDAAHLRLSGTVAVADGAATLRAGGDLGLARVELAGATRSLELQAAGTVVLAQGGVLATQQGAVWARAGGDLVIESITAGTAAVVLQAARLLDGDAAGDTETDIVAGALSLNAVLGIGAAGAELETRAATLSARAGGAGLFVAEADGLAVGSTAGSVQRVGLDGSTVRVDIAAQEDLAVADGGALVLVARSGELRLGGGVATPASALVAGSGPVLLQAEGGRLVVDSGLSGAGPMTLRAQGELSFTSAGRVQLSGGASADLEAGAALQMADGSIVASSGGSLRLQAAGAMTLGELIAGGDVSLLARSIADSGGADIDVRAERLRLVASGGGAGSGTAPLHTSVATLAASVAGTGASGLFVQDTDALRVDRVGPLTVQRVGADGGTTALADAALADVVSAGNVVLRSAGVLTVADGDANGTGVSATGNLLLQAGDGTTPAALLLEPGAALRVAAGHASLRADGDVSLAADIALARAGRSVDIEAGGRVTQAAAAGIDTSNGAVRIAAGGELVLARVGAGNADVSLRAGGAITEATDSAGRGDDAPEVVAAGLRLQAGGGIGGAGERLETRVGAVSARAGDAIWLDEADGIRIADVTVRVNRVGADATATPLDDAAQSDLVTTGGAGTVALLTRAGDIDLTDGSAPADGRAISTFGGARAWLQPGGAGAVLDVPTGAGLQQAGAFELDSGLRLGGRFVVEAGVGGAAGDGVIRIAGPVNGSAGGAADVLELRSDGAAVTLLGAVGAAQPLDRVLVAGAGDVRFAEAVRVTGELRVEASGRVRFDGPLDLAGGSLVIVGASEVVLGDVVLDVGDVEISADSLQVLGRVATGGAAARLVLQSAGDDVDLRVGDGPVAAGVLRIGAELLARFEGFEQLRLAAPGGDLALQAAALAALPPLRALELGAGGELSVDGALRLATPGATLTAQAGGALSMASGASLATAGGDIRLAAGGDLLLGRVDTRGDAGGATLTLQAGGTVRELGSDTVTDLFAQRLVMRGLGPLLAAGQAEAAAALDADVARVDIDHREGSVVRDSGADGRTRFNVLIGDRLYQPVVVAGSPLRDAPAALPADGAAATGADLAWRPLGALRLEPLAWGGSALAAPAEASPAGRATLEYLRVLSADPGHGLPDLGEGAVRGPLLASALATDAPSRHAEALLAAAASWWPEAAPRL